jgi:predicted permease
VSGLLARLRAALGREREDVELSDEVAFHLEMETEANIRLGMDPETARRRARLDFGPLERHKEEVRDARGLGLIEDLGRDARFALRSLLRTPGFTAVALLTLALGIGANAAMFSVVQGVLLRPLPYAEPDALVRLDQGGGMEGPGQGQVSAVDLDDWRAETSSFAAMAGHLDGERTLTERGEPRELPTSAVTEGFFDVFGVPMRLGRPLVAEDARESRHSVVVSERFWRETLAGDPQAMGGTLRLDGESFTVVGVAPASFRYPAPGTDLWLPFELYTEQDVGPRVRDMRHLTVVGRLAPGATPAQAEAELSAVAARLAAEYPDTNADWGAASVRSLRAEIVGEVGGALVLVFGVVGFILLIGCANLANLLLARGAGRAREFAVRSALGAGRTRITRQILTENLLLALAGGFAGLALAAVLLHLLPPLAGDILPRLEEIRLDGRVAVFGLVLALAAGLAAGLVPALRSARSQPQDGLGGGRGQVGSGGERLRAALVVAEVTLAVILVVGAGLMARSFLELRRVDPGFDPEHTLAVNLRLSLDEVPEEEVFGHIMARRAELVERAEALPGVTAAGTIHALPLRNEGESFEFRHAGSDAELPLRADRRYVSPGYLRAMGIPLLRGAPLPDEVTALPLPIHVSEAAARRFWPGEDALGKTVEAMGLTFEVTGITGDVRIDGLAREAPPAVYFPEVLGPRTATTLVVRGQGDPALLAGQLRAMVGEIDPNQPVRGISTLRGVMSESLAEDRFFTYVFALFGVLALGLAALGIYGLLAYSVSRRTGEIGVRMALGARSADVLRQVIGAELLLVGTGIALGMIGALLLAGLLERQLYGISPGDPLTFLTVAGVLAISAALAAWIPARRATRVPPLVALRAE